MPEATDTKNWSSVGSFDMRLGLGRGTESKEEEIGHTGGGSSSGFCNY